MSNPSKYFKIEELTPPGYHNWNYITQSLVDLLDKLCELYGKRITCNLGNYHQRGYREPTSTVGLKNGAHRYGRAADLQFSGISAAQARVLIADWKAQGLLPMLQWVEPDVTWVHVQVSSKDSVPDSNPDQAQIQNNQNSPANIDNIIKPQINNSANKGVAISNEIILSNYVNNSTSIEFFRNIFTKSKIDEITSNKLIEVLGLVSNKVDKAIANSTISLSNEQCENLLYAMVGENRKRLEANFGIKLDQHPREVNTALVSFIFDINLNEEEAIGKISNTISNYLLTKNYNKLADFIEKQGDGRIDSVKFKRVQEAKLIRFRTSDLPNYSNTKDSKINPDEFFSNKKAQLDSEVKSTRNAISKVESSPFAQDEIYQEITKDVSSSFADLLEKQQIITDNFFNEEDSEYLIRINIKNIFNNATRNYNKTYAQVEKDIQATNSPNNHRLSYAYSLFPYANSMYYDVKNNAINRAKYRIKKYEHIVDESISELISLGVSDLLNPIGSLAIRFAINIEKITIAFTRYLKYSKLLENEKLNLPNLIRDLGHYDKKIANIL